MGTDLKRNKTPDQNMKYEKLIFYNHGQFCCIQSFYLKSLSFTIYSKERKPIQFKYKIGKTQISAVYHA